MQVTNKEELLADLVVKVDNKIQPVFKEIQEKSLFNQGKVLEAFRRHRVSDYHFNPSTGYGYDDDGRDTLEKVYAEIFQAEAALVRPQIISGTHAISTALFGVLRPGDELIYVTGTPYDTLLDIVGLTGNGIGSLKEFNIAYQHIDLLADGKVDIPSVLRKISPKTKIIAIQRSRGYAARPSFTINEIKEMIAAIRPHVGPEVVFFVDNCYGEFVETLEPIEVGADLIAGSLIKNLGGGLAPTGGYIAGTAAAVERIAARLTAPGIGLEVGSYAPGYRLFYQGIFMAPHTVAQALKTSVLAARVFQQLGMGTRPSWDTPRSDIIQAIFLESPQKLIAFCRGIQAVSPVDSFAAPEPWDMPGYQDQVIMAAGTFVPGASIELSCDGPLRPPYTCYLQGGLNFAASRAGVLLAIQKAYFKD